MAALAHTQSRRMYSWWWDSHISPKNSKWLQDNLTDMDSKLKAMIKLIEEDADSFARRAEMYYKKRPELMKLVEDFYRAYRALAERYDHATVVIRQAHRTMTEAFPNQVPPILGEDSPENSPYEDDPRTPESSNHKNSPFQTDDFPKDGMERPLSHLDNAKSNGENTGGSDFMARRNIFKQNNLSGPGDYHKLADLRVRKGLNFQDMNEKEQSVESSKDAQARSGQVHEPEEILILRKFLADVQAEKEAGLIQYQQSLDKLAKLESEITRAQEDSRELSERASTAEAEVQNLKEGITKLEAEKDANLIQYHQCLDKISSLEDTISQADKKARELDERACKAESQTQSLQGEIAKLTSEKDVALDQYVLSIEKISNLENRLELAEEDARKLSERAEKAEREIEILRQKNSKLSKEKESAALKYQQSLDTISSLETKLSSAKEEAKLLKNEIDTGVEKLNGAEQQCAMLERSNQTLHAELESLMLKMGAQGQELTEKQKEVGRLWSSVQEERLRFVEAETAFQTLQHLHGQVQEELRTLASELQNRVQILKDVEAQNRELQDEVTKIKEENMGLNELNVSSAISIKNMQGEITILRVAKGKLEEEVDLRVDQRNALQQEIYCLKEELNDLNKKHLSILEQVHTVGFKPESLKSSVTELLAEISNLKETCERERIEKKALLEKLEILAQLLEKNSILENSLSDVSAELEAARGKINALEESCQSLLKEKAVLLDEKASLGSELLAANESLEKLSEKNAVLENSLCDAHDELKTLKVKSQGLEDSCLLLSGQKDGLVSEKDNLCTQLEITKVRLDELEKGLAAMQERCLLLEKDKESALCKIEKLQTYLDEKKQEHVHFAQLNDSRFAVMLSEVHMLQEECQSRKREYDVELDRALHSEIEIFILQRCGEDLKLANKTLLIKYEKLLEAYKLSENLIAQLQKVNMEQRNEVKSLSHQTSVLRKGIFPLLEALDLALAGASQDMIEQDLLNLTSVLHKIEEIKQSFNKTEEETQKLGLEKMVLITLLQQLRLEAEGLRSEKSNIEQELKTRIKHITMLQGEVMKYHDTNEEMKVKLTKGNHREEALKTEMTSLQLNLRDAQRSLEDLQTQNLKILEEKRSLTEETVLLKDINCTLEEENYVMCGEMLSTAYLSMIFKNVIDDKTLKMDELGEHSDKLLHDNGTIQEKLNSTERTLEEVQTENRSLREMLQKSGDELKIVSEIRDKLSNEIGMAKNLLLEEHQKSKIREENLQSELQKQSNEIEILEGHAELLFNQLQISTVCQVLYEQKIHELTGAFDSLNYTSTAKDADMKMLKEKVSMLATENEGLYVQLAAYGPAVTSLNECISSLENKTFSLGKSQKTDTEEFKGVEVANEDSLVDTENVTVPDSFSELQNFPNRVLAIEKTVVEMEQLVMQEKSDVHVKLEAALMRIEELKSGRSLRKGNFKTTSKISEVENGLLTKDIVLDQISESRRQQVEADNQIFELQEADSNGRAVDKAKDMMTPTPKERTNFLQDQSIKKQKGTYPSADAIEKELSVEKLEISKNSVDYIQEGNNGKVLQRLNSDVQKLMNLHITVQDLKGKLEMTEKSKKKGKSVDEQDTLKGQLQEAQATILKLFGLNGKLLKNIQDGSSASGTKSVRLSKDFGSARKEISGQSRNISEDFGSGSWEISGQAPKTSEDFGSARREISGQARRISEKIGRLQLEVQKIQFALLKLLNEKETKSRVLLRHYLYGGLRTNHDSKKKAPFCACIQPKTYGD